MDSLVETAKKIKRCKKQWIMCVMRFKGSYEVSDSSFCSWYDGSNVVEYELTGYDLDKTQFILADSGAIYGLANSELYYSSARECRDEQQTAY